MSVISEQCEKGTLTKTTKINYCLIQSKSFLIFEIFIKYTMSEEKNTLLNCVENKRKLFMMIHGNNLIT